MTLSTHIHSLKIHTQYTHTPVVVVEANVTLELVVVPAGAAATVTARMGARERLPVTPVIAAKGPNELQP